VALEKAQKNLTSKQKQVVAPDAQQVLRVKDKEI
jgi:hypothetical protein